ncbi:class I adenylate-forming enzyme family protein [Phaeovulum sp.]|uniref:class I adenylate-forming enzyme family protein n=1 Tax=Phaeovulum sp. TaxID=2934796 RepID=UPI002730A6E3|nr:class I adenylate-forming enzyme family protein [Phaeovulum sp.]
MLQPDTETNLGLAMLATAARVPDLLAVITDSRMVNYADLARLVRGHAAQLSALDIGPGRVVAVESEDILAIVASLLGTALVGGSWIALKNARALAAVVTPDLVLRSEPGGATDADGIRWVTIDESWQSTELSTLPTRADTDAPFLYNSTSGTTGTPKLMTLSQRVLALRASAARDDFVERETVFCALFQATARPYITRMLAALINGATILHSRDFALWYATGMNHLYGSVAQVAEFLGNVSFDPKLPMIHVSGSKLPDGLARHLLGSFEQVIDLYASSETNRSFKNVKYLDSEGNLRMRGAPLDSEVQIVSDADTVLPPGEIGAIRVRNPYMAKGYIKALEAEARSFRDGWFYPGDFGYFGREGELVISGRSGDVINIGGVKISALAIDEAMRSVTGIADAMCFENPQPDGPSELIAFVVPAAGTPFATAVANLSQLLPALIAPDSIPARFVEINAVPRVHDGGAQRFLCREIYQRLKTR